MKKVLKILGRAGLILLSALLSVILLVLGSLNLLKFPIYAEYYSLKSNICKNPGLGDGFVCQGICAVDTLGAEEKILVSGYMADHSASRIYITDTDNNSYYVSLSKDGKPFSGHSGGIAWHGDTVYLACNSAIHTLSLQSILNAENGDSVEILGSISVNNAASFAFADENYLYVGEFHDGGAYVTEHPYETSDGTYYAIVSRYSFHDLTRPDKIYSIRNKVQGICFTPDGKVVLSTSYGPASSVYYVYNESDAFDSGFTLDGAPLYYLDSFINEIKGPAMAEGLDYYDGKVITLTESASDKYIFGKFFFANKIVGLDIE